MKLADDRSIKALLPTAKDGDLGRQLQLQFISGFRSVDARCLVSERHTHTRAHSHVGRV